MNRVLVVVPIPSNMQIEAWHVIIYINYNVSLGLSLISCFGTSSSINCGVITGKLKHDEVMDLMMIPLCE